MHVATRYTRAPPARPPPTAVGQVLLAVGPAHPLPSRRPGLNLGISNGDGEPRLEAGGHRRGGGSNGLLDSFAERHRRRVGYRLERRQPHSAAKNSAPAPCVTSSPIYWIPSQAPLLVLKQIPASATRSTSPATTL